MFLYISGREISGRELKQSKAAKIDAILSAVGISSQNALHVVDMVIDILYSRTVPTSCCAVGWGYHPMSYLWVFDPEFWIETPDELFTLLSQNI